MTTHVSQDVWYTPVRMATIKWQAAMRKAPEMRMGLRPMLSTQRTAGIVATNMLGTSVSSAGYEWSEHDIRNTDDTSGQKGHGVTCETEGLEDRWGVVQNGVDTRPLLEEHGHGTDGCAVHKGYMVIQQLAYRKQMGRENSLREVKRLMYSYTPSLKLEEKVSSWRLGYLSAAVSLSKRY